MDGSINEPGAESKSELFADTPFDRPERGESLCLNPAKNIPKKILAESRRTGPVTRSSKALKRSDSPSAGSISSPSYRRRKDGSVSIIDGMATSSSSLATKVPSEEKSMPLICSAIAGGMMAFAFALFALNDDCGCGGSGDFLNFTINLPAGAVLEGPAEKMAQVEEDEQFHGREPDEKNEQGRGVSDE
ncbi:MAG: hypothetical protein U0519_04450 [Candidatus Gracilibacteria bacterium]